MTKTPFEEFLEAAGFIGYDFGPDEQFTLVEAPSRAETLKAMWGQLVLLDAEHAAAALKANEDGLIVVTNDPWDEDATVEFHRVTYAGRTVIEAEGVVVCRLIG